MDCSMLNRMGLALLVVAAGCGGGSVSTPSSYTITDLGWVSTRDSLRISESGTVIGMNPTYHTGWFIWKHGSRTNFVDHNGQSVGGAINRLDHVATSAP